MVDKNIADARDKLKVELVKLGKLVEDVQDPEKLQQLADLPPHMMGR